MRHFVATVWLLAFGVLGSAQTGGPLLVSVLDKADTSGLTLTFNYDSQLRAAFPNSTFSWQASKAGLKSPTQSALATFDGTQPNSISVSIPWSQLLGDDTVSASVTLIDATNNAKSTTPAYTRDLTIYKVVTDAQASVTSLQTQLKQATADNTLLVQANSALATKVNPTSVIFKKTVLVTDSEIVLLFETNKPGKIKVLNKDTGKTEMSPAFGIQHEVVFKPLSQHTTYHFSANALDLDGHDIAVSTDDTSDPNLAIPTLDSLPQFFPTVDISPASPTDIDVKVTLDPNNQYSASYGAMAELDYQRVITTAPVTMGPLQKLGKLDLDSSGVPVGPFDQSKVYHIADLNPDTPYSIVYKGVDIYGRTYALTAITKSTLPTPTTFDFDGPVNVSVDPSGGITADWKATAKPQSAEFDVLFGTTVTVQSKASTISSQDVKITSPVAELQKVILASTTSSSPPILGVVMSNGTQEVNRQFTLTFVVPKKGAQGKGLASDTANAVSKVADAASNPSKTKLSWDDLLKTGLGILIKAL